MSLIDNLIQFVSGTKALAEEVNENFETLRLNNNDQENRVINLESNPTINYVTPTATEEMLNLTTTLFKDAYIDSEDKVFGTGSLHLNNYGHVEVENNAIFDINQNGGGFDFRFKLTKYAPYYSYLIGQSGEIWDNDWYLGVYNINNDINGSYPPGAIYLGISGQDHLVSDPYLIDINTWYHVEVSKTLDGITRIFLDGQKIVESGFNQWTSSSKTLKIGSADPRPEYPFGLYGNVDELRCFLVDQAHTDNFTPPTEAYASETIQQYTNVCPTMPGRTITTGTSLVGSGSGSVGSEWGGFGAGALFDKNYSDGWYSAQFVYSTWVQYDFGQSEIVRGMSLSSSPPAWSHREPRDLILKASNTGSFGGEETTLFSVNGLIWEGQSDNVVTKNFSFANENSYRYYRLYVTSLPELQLVGFGELDFNDGMGGTILYEVLGASSPDGDNYDAWHAFDNDVNTGATLPTDLQDAVIGMMFPTPVVVTRLGLNYSQYPDQSLSAFNVVGIDESNNKTIIASFDNQTYGSETEYVDFTNTIAYKGYEIIGTAYNNQSNLFHIQSIEMLYLQVAPSQAQMLIHFDVQDSGMPDSSKLGDFLIDDRSGFEVIEKYNGQSWDIIVKPEADSIPFTPSGDIDSTLIQDAIVEVRDDTDTKIANVNSNIDTINLHLSDIDGSIDTIDSEINDINNSLGTINGDISGIDSSISTINGDINNINNSINTINGDISTIQGDIVNINNEISNIEHPLRGIVTLNGHNPTSISFTSGRPARLSNQSPETYDLSGLSGDTLKITTDNLSEETVSVTFTSGTSVSDINASLDISSTGKDKINISLDGQPATTLTLNLANCITGIGIASEIQSNLTGLGLNGGTCSFNSGNDSYIITSSTEGTASSVVISPYVNNAEDASVDLKLGLANGGTETQGTGNIANAKNTTASELVIIINSGMNNLTAYSDNFDNVDNFDELPDLDSVAGILLVSKTSGGNSCIKIGNGTLNTALSFSENETSFGATGLGYTNMPDNNYLVFMNLRDVSSGDLVGKNISATNQTIYGFDIECETPEAINKVVFKIETL